MPDTNFLISLNSTAKPMKLQNQNETASESTRSKGTEAQANPT